jgi:hypothetical protein
MPSPPYKISSKSTNRFKSCTNLRSLNVHHFGMLQATALNSTKLKSSSMSSPPYKTSSKSTTWFRSYSGVSSHPPQKLNVLHIGRDEATILKKMWHRGHLKWHYLPTKFHKNLPIGSNIISDTHTQAGDLINLLSFFGK